MGGRSARDTAETCGVNSSPSAKNWVSPTPESVMPQRDNNVATTWRLIDANKDRAQRTTTGQLNGQRLWVYGRTGKPCLRCGTPIQHGELGDTALTQRDVWWCPNCQV